MSLNKTNHYLDKMNKIFTPTALFVVALTLAILFVTLAYNNMVYAGYRNHLTQPTNL